MDKIVRRPVRLIFVFPCSIFLNYMQLNIKYKYANVLYLIAYGRKNGFTGAHLSDDLHMSGPKVLPHIGYFTDSTALSVK